jgi:hypothetical protein
VCSQFCVCVLCRTCEIVKLVYAYLVLTELASLIDCVGEVVDVVGVGCLELDVARLFRV